MAHQLVVNNMKRFLFLTIAVSLGVGLLGFATPALAQAPEFYNDLRTQAQASARDDGAGFGTPRDPRETAALILRGALTLVGTIFVGYLIYAGVLMLTAGGDSSKVDKGKSTMRTAVIGVLITLSAYTIVTFVSLAVLSSASGDRDSSAADDAAQLYNPLNWLRGIRGDADNGLGQRRFENQDPLNQPAISPFENTAAPWER